jgi:hypothetical protein
VTLEFTPGVVDALIESSFREVALLYGLECTKVITTPGLFPSSSEDIVDTGQLRASQLVEFPDALEAELSWNTEYAAAVHEGATYKNGRVLIGRPWASLAASRLDLQATFDKIYNGKTGGL